MTGEVSLLEQLMAKFPEALFLLGFLSADNVLAAESELSRRQMGDLAIQSRAILGKHCGECHKEGSTRSALSVLDHKQLTGLPSPVPFAARSGLRSQILEFLDDGTMPPAGHAGPTPAEIAILKQWIAAGAPSYPKAFDPATTQRVLLDDFAQRAEKDRPFVRYLSMAHLVPAGTESPSLKALEFNLQKALAAASEGVPPAPDPVDDSATLFRLDIRTLGWGTPDLFEKVVDHSDVGVYPMNAYDLILLEYPDAEPIAGPNAAGLNRVLGEMKQLRPIPYMKADWFSSALLNSKFVPTPLAMELKSLIQLAKPKLKPKDPPPAGILNEAFADRKSISTALPPLGAFYPKDVSSLNPPFPKLTLESIDEKRDPRRRVAVDEIFNLRLTADADGYFLLLHRWTNGELGTLEVAGGSKFKAGKPLILTPKSKGAFQISGLLNGKDEGAEHFILFASPDEVALPIIVRSRHSEFRIWRFIPDNAIKPGSVQRVVATLEVTK